MYISKITVIWAVGGHKLFSEAILGCLLKQHSLITEFESEKVLHIHYKNKKKTKTKQIKRRMYLLTLEKESAAYS